MTVNIRIIVLIWGEDMYFLSQEERKHLLKGYLPRSREVDIAEELRGWNWNEPPLVPIYDIKLPLYEIANKYCDTGRDVYLKRVENVKVQPNTDMITGSAFHGILVSFIVKAKKLIYNLGVDEYTKIFDELKVPDYNALESQNSLLDATVYESIKSKARLIWEYEYTQAVGRIQDVLARQPYVGEDSLISLALPVIVEQKLDGSFLGLSRYLSADAFTLSEPMVVDLKFGPKKDFHRLTTTGYALVMESVFEFPVNVGCIVYGYFKNNRLIIEKDFHIIDDELRQWFIEQRDDRMRMIYESMDPGVSENCYDSCPYYGVCH